MSQQVRSDVYHVVALLGEQNFQVEEWRDKIEGFFLDWYQEAYQLMIGHTSDNFTYYKRLAELAAICIVAMEDYCRHEVESSGGIQRRYSHIRKHEV